ncbi:Protein of unknown function [Cotesia congregata]|uniref:Uncharacterized protein n=1 Tax=Cotesia congregata TaxID=51543 RepID=A0A8J2HPL6_COTCN|nr:Protein of unknown function [Cotesia congregata]
MKSRSSASGTSFSVATSSRSRISIVVVGVSILTIQILLVDTLTASVKTLIWSCDPFPAVHPHSSSEIRVSSPFSWLDEEFCLGNPKQTLVLMN